MSCVSAFLTSMAGTAKVVAVPELGQLMNHAGRHAQPSLSNPYADIRLGQPVMGPPSSHYSVNHFMFGPEMGKWGGRARNSAPAPKPPPTETFDLMVMPAYFYMKPNGGAFDRIPVSLAL